MNFTRALEIKTNKETDSSLINLTKIPLFDYQTTGVMYMEAAGRCFCFDDTGLGKTPQIIALLLHTKAKRVVYVTRKYLLDQVGDYLEEWSDLSFTIIKGSKKRREKLYEEHRLTDTNIMILSSGTLARDWDRLFKLKAQVKYDTIIFDDVVGLQSYNTQTRQYASYMASEIERRIIMVATGIRAGDPRDMYNMFKVLGINSKYSETEFAKEFCEFKKVPVKIKGRYTKINKFLRPKNMQGLIDYLSPVFIRRSKKDYGKDVKIAVKDYAVLPSANMKAAYNDVIAGLMRNKDTGDDINQITKFSYLTQILDDPNQVDPERKVDHPKHDLAVSLVKDSPDEQFIIYAKFRKSHKVLADMLDKAGIKSGSFIGNQDRINAENKRKFISGEIRVLTVSDAACFGLDGLQGVCWNMIFVNYPYVPDAMYQLLSRIARPGQKNEGGVCLHYIYVEDSCEELIFKKLATRQEVLDSFYGEQKSEAFQMTNIPNKDFLRKL